MPVDPHGIPGPLATLLSAAVRAPSGDNLQPWRFTVDPGARRIALRLTDVVDMGLGRSMDRIALGAVRENLEQTARHNHWLLEDEPARDDALIQLRCCGTAESAGTVPEAILSRVSNRRLYTGKPCPTDLLRRLQEATPILDGVRTHWITEPDRLKDWTGLIGRADRLLLSHPSIRRFFLKTIRFDLPRAVQPEQGMSLAALEISRTQALGLRWVIRLPGWLFRALGVVKMIAAQSRRMVQSASGLCLVVGPDKSVASDLAIGQAMQRAWLALTAAGLAAQPMMALLLLETVWDTQVPEFLDAYGRDHIAALREEFRSLAPEIGQRRPGFLLRFGYAPPPSGRSGRLPWTAVTDLEEAAAATGPPCNVRSERSADMSAAQ
jgi:nitroreductase